MFPLPHYLALFEAFIAQHALFNREQTVLLAVSGGRDSMLMTRFFQQSGFRFGIAHVNFGLRGEASDGDEAFTRSLADSLQVPFHTTRFDTLEYANDKGISIQMAARELRYAWFTEIQERFGYACTATAHHQTDATETILLNLVRGTGLSGLHGILPRRGTLVRPMLFITAAEIAELAETQRLDYREDASNAGTDYRRNQLRHLVLPVLREINPRLDNTFAENGQRFLQAEQFLDQHVRQLRERLFRPVGPDFRIPIEALVALEPRELLLFELLAPFHFSANTLADLAASWTGHPGKSFCSPTHVLTLDRGELLLTAMNVLPPPPVHFEESAAQITWGRHQFTRRESSEIVPSSPNIACLAADLLHYPLQVRSWQRGDYFYPLGMTGKKKLSDFFTSMKIPLPEKKDIPLLVNGNGDIIWVAGFRISEWYKIKPETKKVTIFERS